MIPEQPIIKRVVISLVTWNSGKYLRALLESLAAQTYEHCELLIRDNDSRDDTQAIIAEWVPQLRYPATFFREETNTGYARAHNENIREARRRKANYVMVLNPDLVLDAHAVELLQNVLRTHDKVASTGGKVLQAKFQYGNGVAEVRQCDSIDTTGIVVNRSRKTAERGYGRHDHGQYAEGEVFGISGAFALYRLRALYEVGIPIGDDDQEFFDEDFFAYKEDVDLAWRLQLAGWSAWYAPSALAWHHRTMGEMKRQIVPARLRAFSWRNNWLTLIKNNDWSASFADTLLTVMRELAKLVWICMREWRTFSALPSLLRLWRQMRRKRQWIMEHRRRTPSEMLRVFRGCPSLSSTIEPKGS